MDKLIKIDKKILLFLLILGIVGIIAGSIFVCIINNSDKLIIKEYLLDFVNNNSILIKNNLINNLFCILLIWVLGMSVIGLPFILILYFYKTFVLGFSIGSILYVYNTKGILFSLVYIIPSQIIYFFFIIILMIYSISFSLKLIEGIFFKKNINFKLIFNKYFIIFIILLIIGILVSLYDSYILPYLINLIGLKS